MDFTQTNGLSMIGNDDFVTEEQLSGYVTLDTAQTITGDKTFSSQIVGTANIDISGSGSNTISATNNYFDATTANQLRINTIPKLRIQLNDNAHINDAHYIRNIGETITYASFDGANNILTNLANQITATTNDNSINASVGKNILNSQLSSNELRVFTIPKITTTSSLNTISNTNNTLTATDTTLSANFIEATGAGGGNYIKSVSGGTNRIESVTGANLIFSANNNDYFTNSSLVAHYDIPTSTITSKITTTSSLTTLSNTAHTINGVTTFDVPPVSATAPTTNSQVANKKYVDDTIVAGAFVTLAGTQTITGQKTFTTDLFAAYTSATNNLRLGNVVGKSFMDFRSGGTSSAGGYDVRIESNGGTATDGFGDYVIEAGTTTLDTKTTNTIKSGGVAKITITTTTTELTNTAYNQLSSSQNYIDATADNILRIGGTTKITMNANTTTLDNTTRNSIQIGGVEKLACASTNNLLDNTNSNILRVGTIDKLVTNTTTNTLSNINNTLTASNTTANANYLNATGTGGGNYMNAGTSGVNQLEATSTGSNILSVNNSAKIKTENSQTTISNENNIITATTSNAIRIGSTAKITTTTSLNTISNTSNEIIASSAGTNKIQTTSGKNIIDSFNGSTEIQINQVPRITTTSSIITINPTTQTIISTNGSTMVDITSSRTKLSSTNVDLEGVLITPSIKCGTFSSNVFLSTGVIYANQTNTTITTAGVAMSIGGFAKNNNSCQQSQLPINVVFFGCAFWSDDANQTTARRITLEMTGVDRFYYDVTTGTNYRSGTGVALTSNWSLAADNGYYLQIKTSGSSTTHKAWNIALYYYQY